MALQFCEHAETIIWTGNTNLGTKKNIKNKGISCMQLKPQCHFHVQMAPPGGHKRLMYISITKADLIPPAT